MKLKALWFVLAIAATVLSRAAAPPPAVTFEATEKTNAVTIRVGQNLTIVLPTTDPGFAWEIASNDVRFLKQLSRATSRPGGPTAGAIATFLGARPGRSRLSFAYVRPTQTGETTTMDTREINVTVK